MSYDVSQGKSGGMKMSYTVPVRMATPLISVDLGFGHTKAVRGAEEVGIPSVVGPARDLFEMGLQKKDPVQHLVDLKRDLFVGDLALRQSSTKIFSLKDEKMDQAGSAALLETVLGILSKGMHTEIINLVTGLPVTFYFDQKARMEQQLQGSHRVHIKAGSDEIRKSIVVDQIKVLPQPLGSVMDLLLDAQGQIRETMRDYAKGSIGVLDVGFFTNDLLVLSGLDIVRDYSRSLRSGMSVALKAMADAGIDLPIYELDQRIRQGHFTGAKEKAYKALADQILGEMETYWPLGDLDLIVVTGGAGAELFPCLEMGSSLNVQLMGQMSNVRGYQKIGRRTWG
jgi:plasmid segregation protein ParM